MLDDKSLKDWRRDKRTVLIQRRLDAGGPQRKEWNTAISAALRAVLPRPPDAIVGLYWPFKGEFNSRPLMHRLYDDGVRIALPAVVKARAPLEFRRWHPDIEMTRGVYDIPVPKARNALIPSVLVIPLVGFDDAGYRLGYGGGYYDRTLASLDPGPLRIGVGYELSKLESIHPQSHDIAMNVIVTETAIHDYR